MLLRFAGPQPRRRRRRPGAGAACAGDRALGGALSWAQPGALRRVPGQQPVRRPAVPQDVRVQRQVLAEPTPDLADKTWARLADGTPLVTGEKRGEGWLVLVHTTANTGWTNLALSGLFVDMLQRLVDAWRAAWPATACTALAPWRTLDGFGRLGAAARRRADPAGRRRPRPSRPARGTPPGFYGDENARSALNLGGRVRRAASRSALPGGVATDRLSRGRRARPARWFLLAALAAAAGRPADLAVAARPAAARVRFGARGGRRCRLLLLVGRCPALPAAQPHGPAPPTAAGRPRRRSPTTRRSRAALDPARLCRHRRPRGRRRQRGRPRGLSDVLRNRTAVEPGEPVGVDIEQRRARALPAALLAGHRRPAGAVAARRRQRSTATCARRHDPVRHPRPAAQLRRPAAATPTCARCWRGIDMPPLVAVPADHVLTRSFYLLQDSPAAGPAAGLGRSRRRPRQ